MNDCSAWGIVQNNIGSLFTRVLKLGQLGLGLFWLLGDIARRIMVLSSNSKGSSTRRRFPWLRAIDIHFFLRLKSLRLWCAQLTDVNRYSKLNYLLLMQYFCMYIWSSNDNLRKHIFEIMWASLTAVPMMYPNRLLQCHDLQSDLIVPVPLLHPQLRDWSSTCCQRDKHPVYDTCMEFCSFSPMHSNQTFSCL